MSALLHITYHDHSGQRQVVTLTAGERDEWLIGRRDADFTPDVNLPWDHGVSRRHARIFCDCNAWHIEHLAAHNRTLVDGVPLAAGVPQELLSPARVTVGTVLLEITHDQADAIPDGRISSHAAPDIPEKQRFDVMTHIAAALAQPGSDLLDRLLAVICPYFPALHSAGIALYHDKEISVPACVPRGQAEISFSLARRALADQRAFRWDRAAASAESEKFTSLIGTTQALYAPILRGAQKLGVIYLHTANTFSDADHALLAAISEMLGASARFQPETAHLRLPSVFISYSHQDTDFVQTLAADLRRQRITVWFDERLRGGKDWQDQLAQAVSAADAFALVLSPDSLASKWVPWEIEKARDYGKPIFPLWHRDCTGIPADLDRLHRINLQKDYQRGLLELVEELYALFSEDDTLAPQPSPVVRAAGRREKTRILFLAANPRDTDPLRLSEEIRTIMERMRGGTYRDQFDIIQQGWAVRFSDLQQYLLEYRPHIVHFSGHGNRAGQLILEDDAGNSQPVKQQVLGLLFGALKDSANPEAGVRLVVLNACFSAVQAEAIAAEVGCVLGMTRAVSDPAAIAFAGAFYNALTFGKNVQIALNLAAAAMSLTGEHETPQLLPASHKAHELIFCQEDNT